MPPKRIRNYGVWVATPISYESEGASKDPISPHILLKFRDDSKRTYEAAINVKSRGEESRLVYWFERDFEHEYLSTLIDLDMGFHSLDEDKEEGLDYDRIEGLVDFKRGRLLEHDNKGPNNDILDQLEPILDKAIKAKARIYVFGSRFDSKDGIHNVHMNQGSLPKFDNGIYQDGALMVRYEDHWEAVFLAFASQRVPTDSEGPPTKEARSLVDLIGDGNRRRES
jgi:uncharacterized protein YukJ